jgi:hypothetical protein
LKEARYHWYRAFFLPVLLVSGCSPAEEPASTVVGRLQNAKIDEASGLARSQRYPDVFWVANDDGPSVLYAIDGTGKDLGRVTIRDASNRDWEDLASFTLDGVPYLVAADIGDNEGQRKDVRLYVIEEPEAGDDKVKPEWRIEFTYPEGPRDAESIAVDVENERVLVLTKRDVPALLYSLPLQPGTKKRIDAERLGVVASLPQPSRSDLEFAKRANSWHWQPTSMDISDDGTQAVVLTYGGVFLYPRSPGQGWLEALQEPPLVVSRSANRQAESIAFDAAADAIYITIEQRHAPLFRLPARKPEPEDQP